MSWITLLALIPWAVAVVFLLFALKKKSAQDWDDENFDDEGFMAEEGSTFKIAMHKDKAYWVYQNTFYQSEITWEPDFTTAEAIDTMSLSNKEITELLSVLDLLEEEKER